MTARSHLKLVSLLLAGLAGAGSLAVGFGLTPLSGSVLGSFLGLGPKGDFSLSSSSNSVIVPQGSTGTASITITSLNHFSGDVSITATITASSNAPVVTTSQSSVKLKPDDSASFSVTIATTSSTIIGYHNVTVQGKTNTLTHSITFLAKVSSPPPPPTPDFSLSSNSASLSITQGASTSATLTVSSILSYSGNVALSIVIFPSGVNTPAVSLNLTSLRLPAGGTNATNFFVNGFNSTAASYAIIITGTSGSLGHSLQVSLLVNPVSVHESLNLEFFSVSSPTNAILNLRNTGTVTTTLVSYFVTDASGDKYTRSNWNGPVINPNGLGTANVTIGSSCSGCVLSGAPFTFTPGNSYTITVVTSYGNQFAYSFSISAQESLNLDSFSFPGSTSVIMYIRNTGTVSVQLVSYYVRDASGDTYSLATFAGPTIAPNAVAVVTVNIGSSCPGCTLTGNPFTFMSGYSYSIIFATARANQFTWTVVR
ncbi:MAG TPA: hypothetical protein VGS11_03925 [Candidatus Bathyarchaeia archaeon]|nr:hypothetical protein [Candidatus Bathyarchaeia archaeon]